MKKLFSIHLMKWFENWQIYFDIFLFQELFFLSKHLLRNILGNDFSEEQSTFFPLKTENFILHTNSMKSILVKYQLDFTGTEFLM